METVPQILFVLLITIENFAYGEETLQNLAEPPVITNKTLQLQTMLDVTTDSSFKNPELLETIAEVTSETSLKIVSLEENNKNLPETNQTLNSSENELVQIILKDTANLSKEQTTGNGKNSTRYWEVSENVNFAQNVLAQIATKLANHPEEIKKNLTQVNDTVKYELTERPLISIAAVQKSNSTVSELVEITPNQENKANHSLVKINVISAAECKLTPKLLIIVVAQNSSLAGSVLVQPVLKNLTNLTNQKEETNDFEENSIGSLAKEEEEARYPLSTKPLTNLEVPENSTLPKSEHLIKKPEEIVAKAERSTESLNEINATTIAEYESTTKPWLSSNVSQNSIVADKELAQKVLKKETHVMSQPGEMDNNSKNSIGYLVKGDANTSAKHELMRNPLSSLEASDNSILVKGELIKIVLKDFTHLENRQEGIPGNAKNSTTSTSTAETESTTNSLNSLEAPENITLVKSKQEIIPPNKEISTEFIITAELETTTKSSISLEVPEISNLAKSELVNIVLKNFTHLTSEQEVIPTIEENSTESEFESTAKPSVCLEEYAVKQMNFILDHLLMEMQEFVAKVLQASVNSVFPREYLKRYAEDLNRLLNPEGDNDYSEEEVIEDTKTLTQDEIYEEVMQKLQFIKSKSSNFSQKYLPPDWTNDYRNKKAEMAIWLDKASEQMHNEFNRYITEEDDHIKYQYFSETFDDISRATEIHHKLALLVDLVKIVKNKKQITFMDLYMQT